MISIQRTTSDNPDFRKLVAHLDKDLRSRYDEVQNFYEQFNKIENNKTVVVAYFDNQPIGCGCIKQFNDDCTEIKRMFVLPDFRGQGIAREILRELEKWAKENAYAEVILETGVRQPEAIQLYKKSGYKII